MKVLYHKLKEVMLAVLPVVVIVSILHFFVVPLEARQYAKLLLGSVFVILGLTFFLFGIDTSIDPIGSNIGSLISRSGSVAALVSIGLILGFFISYAEPDLHILANQVSQVTLGKINNILIAVSVSIGVSLLMTLGLIRILKNFHLKFAFTIIYGLIFIVGMFSDKNIIAISFDASGSTTGALTTPFLLSLAAGVSAMRKDSRVGEAGSFGLVGIASGGAVLGMMVAGLFVDLRGLVGKSIEAKALEGSLFSSYLHEAPAIMLHILVSLGPIIVAYVFFQLFFFKHRGELLSSIIKGLVLSYVGLVLFLTGVNAGFMDAGRQMGGALAALSSPALLLIIAFVLGLVTVLAEPAVFVLTHQVEDITGGSVRQLLVLIFLSVAVGLAILLSSVRILVPYIQLWMYLVPGFLIALLLSYKIPELFVGLAFDAGGVASGPMTATFSLAFMQGIASQRPQADVLADGFGMIALVALMPIIAIELLGIIYTIKTSKVNGLK